MDYVDFNQFIYESEKPVTQVVFPCDLEGPSKHTIYIIRSLNWGIGKFED